jgi:membrane protease YdiL (CAAX protease family)
MKQITLQGVLFYLSVAISAGALIREVWIRKGLGKYPIFVLIKDRFKSHDRFLRVAFLVLLAGLSVTVVPTIIGALIGRVDLSCSFQYSVLSIILALANVLIVFIWASIEELIFRGAVLPIFQRYSSPLIALVLSALTFGMMHIGNLKFNDMNLLIMCIWFMDGLCYGAAYLMTDSLWVPTIWHTAHNLGVWIFGFFIVLTPGIYHIDYGTSGNFITLLYACLSAIITIITMAYYFMNKRKMYSQTNM